MYDNINYKFLLGKAIVSSITSFLFYILMLYLGKYVLPNQYADMLNNRYVIWGIVLYSLVVGFRRFQELKDLFGHINVISKIKQDATLPVTRFKTMALHYKSVLSNQEKKLDILKVFSPLPVLIYGLGVYIEDKSKASPINFLSKTYEVSDIFLILGFILFVAFVYSLQKTYSKVKYCNRQVVRYESEEIEYEESLLALKEKRRI